jgi:hypothetical protein
MVEELKACIISAHDVEDTRQDCDVARFLRGNGKALVEAVEQNEALWEIVCLNIDNFRDLPLTDGYYAKWLKRAEALLARAKAGAGGGA